MAFSSFLNNNTDQHSIRKNTIAPSPSLPGGLPVDSKVTNLPVTLRPSSAALAAVAAERDVQLSFGCESPRGGVAARRGCVQQVVAFVLTLFLFFLTVDEYDDLS
ncbi:hypothetical protein Zmor_005274 [Zophobas morio]|uniref:Uncharacterized protein n=1 Tax=Zophobas morio TaxID=2755281 RepID=A0AA38ISZ3_9CUCU|nr:hypothetical protein Zmor_005274 [Zophobas morio]